MNMNHSTAFPYREARIDSAIEIGDLDRQGIERLIRAMFPITMLEDDIDFDAICEAMEGFEPAFIMGTFRRTKSNAIIRTESSNFKLATSDFVLAANGLRNQHDTHHNAFPYRDRENVQPGSQCTTILDWGSKPETDEKVVTRFWIEESGFSDLDTGMVLWSDGKAEHAIDVTRELDPRRLGFLTHKLEKLAPGLTLEQLYFLYMGVLSESEGADDEFFIEAERRGWDD